MRENRTGSNFEKHVHTVEIFRSEQGNEIQIDHFGKPGSRQGYICFTNSKEGCSITGDYGNWICSRYLYPSAEGHILDSYIGEKFRYKSTQQLSKYDPEETTKEIQEKINGGLEEYGYEGEDLQKAIEWYTNLLSYVDDEIEYTYQAYRDCYKPDFIDYDEIPFAKEPNIQLMIIFDAFDEMCRRLKEKEFKNSETK